MTMQLGEVAEIAMWADGRETTDDLKKFSMDIKFGIERLGDKEGLIFSPIRVNELRPGEGRSPKVPKHISGPNVRLIVGEATVMGFRAKGSLKLLRDSVH